MELLFFGIIGILQVKRVTKLNRQQNLSLWMQKQMVLLPILRSSLFYFLFFSFFFQPPSEFWYFVQPWYSYDSSSVIEVDSSSNRKSSNLLGHWLSLAIIGCVPLAAAPSIHGLVK
jgi:hypothetical protein